MSNSHIFEQLNKCYTVNGKLSFNKISEQLINEIKDKTSFLDPAASLSERIYCLKSNITIRPICNLTGKYLRFSPNRKCYNNSYEYGIATRKKGVINKKNKNQQIKEHLQQIFLNKNYLYLNNDEILQKINKIHLTIKKITPDIVKTDYNLFCNILDRTHFLPSTSTWGERVYCIKNNIISTVRDVYGLPCKYVNSNKGYSSYGSKISYRSNKHDHIRSMILKQKFTLQGFNYDTNGYLYTADVTCMKCGEPKTTLINCGYWQNIYCPSCYGTIGRSKIEEDICIFLQEHGIHVIKNDKSIIPPREIDIFIPDKNIGIEINGVLWHSVGTTYPNTLERENYLKTQAVSKLEDCNKKNIQLITVFDSEWYNKQDIIKSIILAKLHIFTNKVYARKCSLEIITTKEANQFYDINHLQGGCKQIQKSYCLKYNNEIVCCMSFGKRKITKGDVQNELIRFCTKQNTCVVGGGSRLMTHALANGVEAPILSYCDRRYGTSHFYESLGFQLERISSPNYWYTNDCNKLLHRSNFQKHKIVTPDTQNLTESQIMYSKGYRRIFDCGNLILTKK